MLGAKRSSWPCIWPQSTRNAARANRKPDPGPPAAGVSSHALLLLLCSTCIALHLIRRLVSPCRAHAHGHIHIHIHKHIPGPQRTAGVAVMGMGMGSPADPRGLHIDAALDPYRHMFIHTCINVAQNALSSWSAACRAFFSSFFGLQPLHSGM